MNSKEPGSGGTAAMYGMLDWLLDREGVHKVILVFIDGMTRLEERSCRHAPALANSSREAYTEEVTKELRRC